MLPSSHAPVTNDRDESDGREIDLQSTQPIQLDGGRMQRILHAEDEYSWRPLVGLGGIWLTFVLGNRFIGIPHSR